MVQKWSDRGNIVRCFETSVKSAAEMHSMIIVTIIFIKQKLKKHENANN